MNDLNISTEKIDFGEIKESIGKLIVKDCIIAANAVKKYIEDYRKKNGPFLDKCQLEVKFWSEKEDGNTFRNFYIIHYYWLKTASWDKENKYFSEEEQKEFNDFLEGITTTVGDTLRKLKWKLEKDPKGIDYIYVKDFNGVTVDVDLYTGDNDGNHIGPKARAIPSTESILAPTSVFDVYTAWFDGIDVSNEKLTEQNKPIEKPRTPDFKGTETIPWGGVKKTFEAFVEAYYERTNEKKPEKVPQIFSKCSEEMRKWISRHSILGNPESTVFDDAVVLPVVNPSTGKLNKGAVSSANAYADQVSGISEETLKKTKKYLSKMYKKYFSKDEE